MIDIIENKKNGKRSVFVKQFDRNIIINVFCKETVIPRFNMVHVGRRFGKSCSGGLFVLDSIKRLPDKKVFRALYKNSIVHKENGYLFVYFKNKEV